LRSSAGKYGFGGSTNRSMYTTRVAAAVLTGGIVFSGSTAGAGGLSTRFTASA